MHQGVRGLMFDRFLFCQGFGLKAAVKEPFSFKMSDRGFERFADPNILE